MKGQGDCETLQKYSVLHSGCAQTKPCASWHCAELRASAEELMLSGSDCSFLTQEKQKVLLWLTTEAFFLNSS